MNIVLNFVAVGFLAIISIGSSVNANSLNHHVIGEIQEAEVCLRGNFVQLDRLSLEEISQLGLSIDLDYRKFVKKILLKIKSFKESPQKATQSNTSKKWKTYQKGMLSVNEIDCDLPVELRLTGDLLDHLDRKAKDSSSFFHSMKIKLKHGSLNSVSAFKLLRPATRGGIEEVFVTLIFKELGFLAPDTFLTHVKINGGTPIEVLLQEDLDASFLERNSLSESMLFEGDESFGLANRDTVTRAINSSLPVTNLDIEIAQRIKEYLDNIYTLSVDAAVRADEELVAKSFDPLVHPKFFNRSDIDEQEAFSALAIGTSTKPGLSLDDSRFVYDKINRQVRPIYYDGHPTPGLKKDGLSHQFSGKLPFFMRQKTVDRVASLVNQISAVDLVQSLKSRGVNMSEEEVIIRLETIVSNMYKPARFSSADNDASPPNLPETVLLESAPNIKIMKENYIRVEEIVPGVFMESAGFDSLIVNKLARKVSASVGNGNLSKFTSPWTTNPMLRVFGGRLSGWEFEITYSDEENSLTRAPRGKLEYTGCILFHDIELNNLNIKVDKAPCEDAIHLVRVVGSKLNFFVANSFADGIDADFSVIEDMRANVSNSGNDCLDFSFGRYSVFPMLSKCEDKGISVGETANVEVHEGFVEGAKIGIASKDGAHVKIDGLEIKNAHICFASYRKKNKFPTGNMYIIKYKCEGKIDTFQQQ